MCGHSVLEGMQCILEPYLNSHLNVAFTHWQNRLSSCFLAKVLTFQKFMINKDLFPFEECCTSRAHVFIRDSVTYMPLTLLS